jgi:hypothetical protein
VILTAHQPVYLPWLGLIKKIAQADVFVSWDAVQYTKRDWVNRNYIKTAHGPQMLTVPVYNGGHRSLAIRDVRINNTLPWARKHLKSFEQAYAKAHYAEEHLVFLRCLYATEWRWLMDLNAEILEYVCRAFDLYTSRRRMGEYVNVPADHVSHGKSDVIATVCRIHGADTYLFGEMGKDYADREAFEHAGIVPEFQEFTHPVYPQQHGEFVPRMCAFDLLMNVGAERAREVLLG